MNNFENTTQGAEVTHEQVAIETAQSMREIDELQITAEESLHEMTDYLDEQESPLNEEKVGILRSIGEKFKKSKLLKAAALAVTFMSVQGTTSSFAESYSGRLTLDKSHQLNVGESDFNNPSKIRLQNVNQLRLRALQPEQLSINGKNVLLGHISHFSRNTLPNATINGGPAYEIAPNIYGDKNTIYRQTSGGGTVLVGGIHIE
ncbi:MAG: hypothetical protein ACKUBY_01615 [Candidatus Moraniibacteriota bacterium]|jgi:hypothetical protein